jgi:hypothetical protein
MDPLEAATHRTDEVQKVLRVIQLKVTTLVVRDPAGGLRRVELRDAPIRVGTHPESDLLLDDEPGSR